MNYAVLYGSALKKETIINELKSRNLSDKVLFVPDSSALKTSLNDKNIDIIAANVSEINIEELAKITVYSGWKSFRIGTLDLNCEDYTGKLFVVYKGFASMIFDDYIFSKEMSLRELLEYVSGKILKIKKDDLRLKLKRIFAKIGIYSNLLGYEYLIESVVAVINDKKLVNSLTTELYPMIAKKFSTTEKNVERNMRNAIEVSFNRGKFFETANSIGGNFTPYEKPSNGEFIAFLAEMISE